MAAGQRGSENGFLFFPLCQSSPTTGAFAQKNTLKFLEGGGEGFPRLPTPQEVESPIEE